MGTSSQTLIFLIAIGLSLKTFEHHAEQTVEKINYIIVLFGKINERR